MENFEGRLHFARVVADGAEPRRWMLVLHGILGSGGNLRSLAKRLVAAAPEWGLALVDLRMHGASLDFAPPHTLDQAARDLFALEDELPGPIAGAMGHSFGGKTALDFAGQRAARGMDPLDELVILDASPSARAARRGATEDILAILESLPPDFASRDAFVAALRQRGSSAAIAEWLAMNVRRDGDAFRFRLDLKAIRALLDDYHARDLWSVLEDERAARRVDVVVAGKSETVDAADRARLEQLAARGRVHVHVLHDSTHWVHVDDPDGVFRLVKAALLGQNAAG